MDKIVMQDTISLIPYARNPREHSETQINQIAASIKEWGFTVPILVDEDGMVIAGHGRLFAAQKISLKQVPTITATGWSDAKKRAYIIADNKIASNSNWDDDLLKVELEELIEADFDVSLLGWGDELPSFGEDLDLSALEEDFDVDVDSFSDGVMRGMMIEFEDSDYEEAKALVDEARKNGVYIGLKLMEALR